jgi:serine/threonine protein kinase
VAVKMTLVHCSSGAAAAGAAVAAFAVMIEHTFIVRTITHSVMPYPRELPPYSPGTVYTLTIVQELCAGGSLAAAIDRGDLVATAAPLTTVLHVALMAACALSAMHVIGVVHGRLHTKNVLFQVRSLCADEAAAPTLFRLSIQSPHCRASFPCLPRS